jgi:HEAT repeat protein
MIWVLALGFGANQCVVAAEEQRIERLARLLGSEQFDEREKAAKELVEIGAPGLEVLRRAATSPDAEIARRAKECVQRIELNVKVGIYLRQLRSTDNEERLKAVRELSGIGRELRTVLPSLVELLDDPDIQVKEYAVIVLGGIGPEAESALPKLLGILKEKGSGTSDLRLRVMQVLKPLGPSGRKGVPILIEILETDTPQMQEYAAHTLGKIGQENPRVGSALLKAVSQTGNWEVQYSAAFSLAQLRMEGEKAVPAILKMLRTRAFDTHEEESRERTLVFCLGLYGSQAAPAIPYLVGVVKDEKRRVSLRENALEVLIQIGPMAHEAVPGLKDLKGRVTSRVLEEITEQLNQK